MDNDPNPETLQELRSAVARYGVGEPLPQPLLRHCDDCQGYGAVFGIGPALVCLEHWLMRRRVAARDV